MTDIAHKDEPIVVIPIGLDCRDPNQRDPLYKTFRGAALKKLWEALT